MDDDLSAQQRADLLRQRAARARQEAERLDGEAARWQSGADGERRVAAALSALASTATAVVVLHDRLLDPARSRVNLDHVVATSAGVFFLVDAKNWSGQLTVHDDNLWQHLGLGDSRRHLSKHAELDKVARSAGTMQRLLGGPVVPVLALANPTQKDLAPTRVRGVNVVPAAQLVPWLTDQPGTLTAEQVDSLRIKLEASFPPATQPTPVEPSARRRIRSSAHQHQRGRVGRTARGAGSRSKTVRRDIVKVVVLPAVLALLILNLGTITRVAGSLLLQAVSTGTGRRTTTPSPATPPPANPGVAATGAIGNGAPGSGPTLLDGSPAPAKPCQGIP